MKGFHCKGDVLYISYNCDLARNSKTHHPSHQLLTTPGVAQNNAKRDNFEAKQPAEKQSLTSSLHYHYHPSWAATFINASAAALA